MRSSDPAGAPREMGGAGMAIRTDNLRRGPGGNLGWWGWNVGIHEKKLSLAAEYLVSIRISVEPEHGIDMPVGCQLGGQRTES